MCLLEMRAKKPHHKRRHAKKQIERLCGEAWPEDGVDPLFDRLDTPSRAGRKALQLCRQVQRALDYALAECADAIVSGLSLVSVQPAPHSGRLLVTLRCDSGSGSDVGDVLARLHRASGKLRCDVAAAICRKKTPELAFCVIESLHKRKEPPKNSGALPMDELA